MKIESKDTEVQSLLSSNYFHIPRFQRPYSWDEENINDFWSDVCVNKGQDYFIGSMVVYKQSKQQLGIVDGQQRLTTITILLCALRDAFFDLGCEDQAEGIQQLIERKNLNNKPEYVLKTETSYPFLQEHVQKFKEEPETETEVSAEEKSIKNASIRFKAFIQNLMREIDEKPPSSPKKKNLLKTTLLEEIRESVLNLNVILISLDNEEDAYLIFETLNTRGKDLSLTDLVKNHFTKHLKANSSVDGTSRKWAKMLETIRNSSSEISADNFIHHFWASRHDSATLKNLFPKIKREITKPKAKDYLNYLISDSNIYRSIHEAGYGWDRNESDVAKSLMAIQMFRLSQPTPAILSLIRSYKDKIIKYAKLRDTLSAIEKFHFIFTAVTSSRSSGGISAMYSSFAKKLFESKNSNEAAKEISSLVGKLKLKLPDYDEFEVSFKKINYTNLNTKQKNLVRYILRKFGEHHGYKFSKEYDELSIEHIYPQAKIDKQSWNEEVVGCLGNMIFIEPNINEELGTKDFLQKIAIFESKNCSVPEYVSDQAEWTAELVSKHTNQMADIAYKKIWKI